MTLHAEYSGPGEGTGLTVLDAVHTVKMSADTTDGLFELFEIDMPRGHAVPPHRHAWLEAYYVLQGRMTAHVGDIAYELLPGSSLIVPPHAMHTVMSTTPLAKFLVFTLTDAMGRFFTDLHRTVPAGRALEDVVPLLLEVTERHGVMFAAPTVTSA